MGSVTPPFDNMKKILIAILLASFAVLFSGCNMEYGDGQRTGVPFKVSNKGIFCKTYEGTMNLGGVSANGDGVMTLNSWHFTVDNAEIARQIDEAAEQSKRLTLFYKELMFQNPCYGDTNYHVYAVKYQ